MFMHQVRLLAEKRLTGSSCTSSGDMLLTQQFPLLPVAALLKSCRKGSQEGIESEVSLYHTHITEYQGNHVLTCADTQHTMTLTSLTSPWRLFNAKLCPVGDGDADLESLIPRFRLLLSDFLPRSGEQLLPLMGCSLRLLCMILSLFLPSSVGHSSFSPTLHFTTVSGECSMDFETRFRALGSMWLPRGMPKWLLRSVSWSNKTPSPFSHAGTCLDPWRPFWVQVSNAVCFGDWLITLVLMGTWATPSTAWFPRTGVPSREEPAE